MVVEQLRRQRRNALGGYVGEGLRNPEQPLLRPQPRPDPEDRCGLLDLARRGTGVSRVGLTLSYKDLLALPAVSVTRALECAGNGRVYFGEQEGREAEGTPWRLGAVGVAEWTGAPLRRLLEEAGLVPSAVEVIPRAWTSRSSRARCQGRRREPPGPSSPTR